MCILFALMYCILLMYLCFHVHTDWPYCVWPTLGLGFPPSSYASGLLCSYVFYRQLHLAMKLHLVFLEYFLSIHNDLINLLNKIRLIRKNTFIIMRYWLSLYFFWCTCIRSNNHLVLMRILMNEVPWNHLFHQCLGYRPKHFHLQN